MVVFLKAPRSGLVKTRLARDLGNAGAVAAYREIVDHLLVEIRDVQDLELRFTPDDAEPEISHWLNMEWLAAPQGDGDLGRRLERAIAQHCAAGARKVVIIGADCPEITLTDIADAFDALERADLVLGPATDGGYWLIGLRNPQPDLFHGMPWSSEILLNRTREKARHLQLRVAELRTLTDIDTLEDWRRWKQTGSAS